MIDWLKTKIPYVHPPIHGGGCVIVNEHGEPIRETKFSRQVPGSHDSRVMVSSWGAASASEASHLIVCGNPSKFLQGHNVVGIDDASLLHRLTVDRIAEALEFPAIEYRDSEVAVSWLDVNYMYQLNSLNDVRAWLAAAEFSARSRSGRAIMTGSTVYLQKHSRRWAIKFYSKYDEFASHPLPDELVGSGLVAFAENLLRVELRLFKKELEKIGVKVLSDISAMKIPQIFGEYMSKITMSDRVRLPYTEAMDLPAGVRATYALWHDGHDVRSMLSRPTFYRHRTQLLEHGIDISMTAPTQKTNNVIPLMRSLTATQIQIPAWIYERKLIAGGN